MTESSGNKIFPFFKRSYGSKDILLLAFVILCLNIVINLFNKYYLGLTFPYDTFLHFPWDRFADFLKVIDALHVVETWEPQNPYDKYWYVYAIPFGTVYYYFFAVLILILNNKYLVYILLSLFLLSSHFVISKKLGNSYWVILLSMLSYPVIFTIDRGNYAFAVYVLIFFALTTDKILLASLAIAVATSLKITPAIFVVLLVFMKPFTFRRTISILLTFALSLFVINFFSIRVIETQLATTPFNYSEFTELVTFYYKDDITNLGRMAYSSSLFLPLLYVAAQLDLFDSFVFHIKPFFLPLFIFSVITGILLLNDNFVRNLNKWLSYEKLVYMTCLSFVLFMPVTADYYLLVMFLPLLIFSSTRYSFGYFIVYGLLLGAKNIFFFKVHDTHFATYDISFQALINPLLLLLLLFAEFDLAGPIRRESPNSVIYKNSFFRFIEKISERYSFQLKPYKKTIIIFTSIALTTWLTAYQVEKAQCKTHNIEIGLPVDFDPAIYLRLNPGLEEYWKASGINESGQRLLDHAEEHYKGFGARDRWKYKNK